MKKHLSLLLICIMLLGMLASCNSADAPEQTTSAPTVAPETTLPETEEQTELAQPINLTDPVFSVVGGLYKASQKLTLQSPKGTDYTVRYTTDGSVPTKRLITIRTASTISVIAMV